MTPRGAEPRAYLPHVASRARLAARGRRPAGAKATPSIVGALAALALSLGSGAASDAVEVYGVSVRSMDASGCASPRQVRDIKVKAAPFGSSASLSEIISELARRARELGADTLYGISVLAEAPGRGVEAAATAAICRQGRTEAGQPSRSALLGIAAGARGAEANGFAAAGDLGPERNVLKSRPQRIATLPDRAVEKLRRLVVEATTRSSGPRIASSCPFIPDIGFRLSGEGEAWWLVSFGRGCDAALLVRAEESWRQAQSIELDAKTVAQFKELAR